MGTDERDDAYWIGVRDALRMIDSFIRWARRHPNEAKPIEEFIAEGIEAAARRCESCLKRSLGLSFKRKGDTSEPPTEPAIPGPEMPPEALKEQSGQTQPESLQVEPESIEPPPIIEESTESESEYEPPQITTEPEMDSGSFEETSHLSQDSSPLTSDDEEVPVSSSPTSDAEGPPIFIEDEIIPEIGLDSDHRLSELEELTEDTQPRDFQAEFEIEEPHNLVVSSPESSEVQTDQSTTEMESIPPEAPVDEAMTPEGSELEPSDRAESSGFTWSEYEDMVTPHEESEPIEEPTESDANTSIPIPPPPEVQPPETPESEEEPTEVWSPYDEPEVHIEEPEDDDEIEPIEDMEEPTPTPLDDTPPETSPPPPPPPPEPDETDEERKRRARLLFFGSDS